MSYRLLIALEQLISDYIQCKHAAILVREEDMKTRFLSLGLIFIMIISLAGCSGNTEEAEISEETDVFDEEETGTEERDHGAERQKVRTKHLREMPILPFRSRIKIQGSNGTAAGISPAAFPLCRYGAVCNLTHSLQFDPDASCKISLFN